MILWTIKQLMSLRQAVVGRARPAELAWGLAIGLAIGLVPKGNLISVALIGLAVSLRINHGMVALAAVSFSFLAVRFDPLTHQLGADILQAPRTRQWLDRWWDTPLVPWTDLNNTVVMGSTVVALVAMLPTFLVSLPVFRYFSPRGKGGDAPTDPPPSEPVVLAQVIPACDAGSLADGVDTLGSPTAVPAAATVAVATDEGRHTPAGLKRTEPVGTNRHGEVQPTSDGTHATAQETQIDIIRIEHVEDGTGNGESGHKGAGTMNEALGYLLRRLKDTRQEKVA